MSASLRACCSVCWLVGIGSAAAQSAASPPLLSAAVTAQAGAVQANAPPDAPLTLEAVLTLARANSQQLRAALSAAQIAAEDRVQARAGLLPAVSGFLQHIRTEENGTPSGVFISNDGPRVYNAWLTTHGDLFAPQRWAEYRATAAAEAVARARADVAARGIITTVVQNYYAVAAAFRKVTSARQSLSE